MYIKFLFLFVYILLFLQSSFIYSQKNFSKIGGIAFRVDDNQDLTKYNEFISLLNYHNVKLTGAFNLTSIKDNQAYINFLKRLQSEGHEIADHTPNHRIQYFTGVTDTAYYHNKDGVHHINGQKICLAYDSIRTDEFNDEGLINIYGNIIISQRNGEFKNHFGENVFLIYIPSLDKLCLIKQLFNKNPYDPDTLIINSFWDEPFDLGIIENVVYRKVSTYGVYMKESALKLLVERTRIIALEKGLLPPKCWIQPGTDIGQNPILLTKSIIKNSFGNYYNLLSGSTYRDKSFKCYNEYDPNQDACYSMGWGDFLEDLQPIEEIKRIIADRFAKHFVSIGHSHFSNLLGGWTGYLARLDNLITWCKKKGIPIKTYSEWADLLYRVPQNPYVNIFPKLNVDLDEDNWPDGYYYSSSYGSVDTSDGIPTDRDFSFTRKDRGTIFYIQNLGGIEKGENQFEIWTKGAPDDSIEVIFQIPNDVRFKFPANTLEWKKYTLANSTNNNKKLIIPDTISTINIICTVSDYSSGIVKVSGMSLKKMPKTNIAPPFGLTGEYSNYKINLNWIDNSDNEKGFQVERRIITIDSAFNIVGVTNMDVTEYTDSISFSNINDTTLAIQYRVVAFNDSIFSEYSDTLKLMVFSPLYVDTLKEKNTIKEFKLLQNYPNPFNNSTNFQYWIPEKSRVLLEIFDILGRKVETIFDGILEPGEYKNEWLSTYSSGIYFCRLIVIPTEKPIHKYESSIKIVVLK